MNVDLVAEELVSIDSKGIKCLNAYPGPYKRLQEAVSEAKRHLCGMFEFGDVEDSDLAAVSSSCRSPFGCLLPVLEVSGLPHTGIEISPGVLRIGRMERTFRCRPLPACQPLNCRAVPCLVVTARMRRDKQQGYEHGTHTTRARGAGVGMTYYLGKYGYRDCRGGWGTIAHYIFKRGNLFHRGTVGDGVVSAFTR